MFLQDFDGVGTEDSGWPLLKVTLNKVLALSSSPSKASYSEDTSPNSASKLSPDFKSPKPDRNKLQLLIYYSRIFTQSPFGRATKDYVMLDLDKMRLKFFKDCWQYEEGNYNSEIDVYYTLLDVGIKNIGKVKGGGNVLDKDRKPQSIVVQEYLKKSFNNNDEEYLSQYYYYLVIRQLGTLLKKYANSYSLIKYLILVIIAHYRTWLAGVLHHDISLSNIMIDKDAEETNQQAFLIDWDLCRYKYQLSKGRSQKSHSELLDAVKWLAKLCKKHYETIDIEILEASFSKVLKKDARSMAKEMPAIKEEQFKEDLNIVTEESTILP
ncbi:hypothetical protein C8Q75DRAFT_804188 [Abortiporus biennis]|nr:hypothetical protein C8Q75DRAFT_804188 [Abortiporus biennis]